jgi:hypothetical protein
MQYAACVSFFFKIFLYAVLKYFLLFVFTSAIAFSANGQTLKGVVRDADNGLVLYGVEVQAERSTVRPSAAVSSTQTDSSGRFRFDHLPPGAYTCVFSANGYERSVLRDIAVAAGKETATEVNLRRIPTNLPELTIVADETGGRRAQPLGEVLLTREQTLRYPATFFDPARLALAAPGVAGADDQANGMSVRGATPAGLRWRLEGVDIVNPNHLAGAGTFSDLPAPASGGVLMFSAQLIDRSALLTGNFPAGYGDGTAGMMDMYLREGNVERREYTLQAGLLGIDLAAEGPLTRRQNASWLVNYRYSTVGLLGQMGVSFGDEQIAFQDLSFNLHFSGKRGGAWTVFGMGGQSSNFFVHTEDRTQIEQYKALFDIDYAGKTGLAGFTHWMSLGQKTWIRTVFVGSAQENRRRVVPFFSDFPQSAAEAGTDQRVAGQTTLQHRVNNQNRLRGGMNWSVRRFSGDNRWEESIIYRSRAEWLPFLQPWAGWEWNTPRQRTLVKSGIHSHIATFNGRVSVEPRLSVEQRVGRQWRVAGAWGLHSEALPVWLYSGLPLRPRPAAPSYRSLDFIRSTQSSVRAEYRPAGLWHFSAEAFRRNLRRVPVLGEVANAFSLLNVAEGQLSDVALVSNGEARQYGVELLVDRRFENGIFWNANATWLRSEYTGSDQTWRPQRWEARYIFNTTGGKEWEIAPKNGQARVFGCSGRMNWRQGFLDTPVTPAKNPLDTRIQTTGAVEYTRRLPDFYRLDLRFYWKRHIGDRRNSTLAFDLQNATNARNTAYYYYDAFTGRETTRLQLGLIPNISWKVEF